MTIYLTRRVQLYLGAVVVLVLLSCVLSIVLAAQQALYYLNGVPYLFPASQGTAGTLLTNNGSGTLTWSPAPTPEGIWAGGAILSTTNCPTGWTRDTAGGGMYLVIAPVGGTVGGMVGTAMTNLENRQHAHAGVSHQHTGTVHGHPWSGGNTSTAGDHSHAWSSGFSGSGNYSGSSTTAGENNGTMNVDGGSSGLMARAGHGHDYSWSGSVTVNGSVGGQTSGGGNHTHGPGDLNIGLEGGGVGGASGTGNTGANNVMDTPYKQLILCTKN